MITYYCGLWLVRILEGCNTHFALKDISISKINIFNCKVTSSIYTHTHLHLLLNFPLILIEPLINLSVKVSFRSSVAYRVGRWWFAVQMRWFFTYLRLSIIHYIVHSVFDCAFISGAHQLYYYYLENEF